MRLHTDHTRNTKSTSKLMWTTEFTVKSLMGENLRFFEFSTILRICLAAMLDGMTLPSNMAVTTSTYCCLAKYFSIVPKFSCEQYQIIFIDVPLPIFRKICFHRFVFFSSDLSIVTTLLVPQGHITWHLDICSHLLITIGIFFFCSRYPSLNQSPVRRC